MNKSTITAKTGMTTPKAKPASANRGATLLKTTLVIGSIVATLLGTQLAPIPTINIPTVVTSSRSSQ